MVTTYSSFKKAPDGPKFNSELTDFNKSTTFMKNTANTLRIRLENHVFTVDYDKDKQTKINLKRFYKFLLRNKYKPQYNGKRFAACIVRIPNPRTAALVYPTNMVIAGTKNVYQGKEVVLNMIELLRKAGYTNIRASKVVVRLQNIVTSVVLDSEIDLKSFSEAYSGICNYSSIFPAAQLKIPSLGKINIAVHSAGKLVITGPKNIKFIKKAIDIAVPMVLKHRSKTGKTSLKTDISKKNMMVNSAINKAKIMKQGLSNKGILDFKQDMEEYIDDEYDSDSNSDESSEGSNPDDIIDDSSDGFGEGGNSEEELSDMEINDGGEEIEEEDNLKKQMMELSLKEASKQLASLPSSILSILPIK